VTDPVIVGDQIVGYAIRSGGIVPGVTEVTATERDRFTPRAEDEARRAFSGVDDYHRTPQLAAQHQCDPACPQYRDPASDYSGPIIQGRRDRNGRPLEPVTPGRASC